MGKMSEVLKETFSNKDKDKKKSFMDWVSTRWYYWVILIIFILSNSLKYLYSGYWGLFLGSLIGSFVGITLIFMLISYPFYWYKHKKKSSKKLK